MGRLRTVGLLLVASSLLAACDSGAPHHSSSGAPQRAATRSVPGDTIAGVLVPTPRGYAGAAMVDNLSTVAVRWAGTQVGQDPNPLVPTPYTITPATHPLVTIYLKNAVATSQTFAVDMFITTQPPPAAFGVADVTPIPYQLWPGGLWDWATAQPARVPGSVAVPAGATIAVSLDWPQQAAAGATVGAGHYWAVVFVVAPPALAAYLTPEIATPIILSK